MSTSYKFLTLIAMKKLLIFSILKFTYRSESRTTSQLYGGGRTTSDLYGRGTSSNLYGGAYNVADGPVTKTCDNFVYTFDKELFNSLDKSKNNFVSPYEIRKGLQSSLMYISHQTKVIRIDAPLLIQAADIIKQIFRKSRNSEIRGGIRWIDMTNISCKDLMFLETFYGKVVEKRKKIGSEVISQLQILRDFAKGYQQWNATVF